MLLSIITPVYNVAHYLPATIESILNQSFRDFELILIDDGSTDGSNEICCRYANSDPRIRIIRQENQGVSAARNKGLECATGDIIGFVDSDDIIDHDMYQCLISTLLQSEADIVQCSHDRVSYASRGKDKSVCRNYECIDGKQFVRRMFTKQGSDYTNQVALWSKIYRKSLFKNIHFPEGQTYEDEHETYKICLAANRIALIEEPLYHYIHRDNSIITGTSPRKMLDKQKAIYDRLLWLPVRLPELEKKCVMSFAAYSEHILCDLWQAGETTAANNALNLMLKGIRGYESYLNRYDRFYIRLLRHGLFKDWILRNSFAPLQKLISKIRR